MGVLDKLLRGVGAPDRSRKTTPSRPASTIGSTVRGRQSTPIRPAPRPTVPVKHRTGGTSSSAASVVSTPATVKEPAVKKPVSPPAANAPSPTPTPAPAFDAGLQKKLDRYFDRLRAVYPNGVISRLNTGQKKLAERGAQLRHMCGMENQLDEFFALGGFTYERTAGGRPRNVQNATAQTALITEVKSLFPNGVSSAAELNRADHALYLRLRSAARLSGGTITEFMNVNDLNCKGDKAV